MILAWDCPFKHIYLLNGELVDINTKMPRYHTSRIVQIKIIKNNNIKKNKKSCFTHCYNYRHVYEQRVTSQIIMYIMWHSQCGRSI